MQSLADLIQPVVRDETPGYSYVDEIDVFVHDTFATLVQEIREELSDARFQRYRHARCATNNKGCSGPMCRWARRTWQHNNAEAHAARKGRKFRPKPLLENAIAEQIYKLFDEHIERVWQGRREKDKLHREIQKAVQKVSAKPESLGNLQTAGAGPALATHGLMFAELL